MVTNSTRSRVRPRLIVSIAALATSALAFAGCAGGSADGDGGDASDGTVTIGMINQYNQPGGAESADDWQDGADLAVKYIEENGGLYNGAKIKFNQQPESGTQTSLVASSLRSLFNDDVKLLIGPALSADCLAAAGPIDQAGAVSTIGCTTTSLTGPDRPGKNQFRWDTNDLLTSSGLAAEVAKDYSDVEHLDIVAYDYVQGHEGVKTFVDALKSYGVTPKVDNQFYVPASTTNYQAQISKLAQAPKTGKRILVLLTWGSGYLNFIQQATPLDLFANYDAIMTTSMYYKTAVALNGKAPKVWNSYGTCYYSVWDNPIMEWFAKQMQSTYKRLPDDWSTVGFNQVLVYAAAINEAKSTDPAKVLDVMKTLKVDTATGTQTMEEATHQAQRQVPVCQTEGDPSAPEGVKLVQGSLFDSAELVK